uniref:ATP synthase complex subunit 8 n=1 Tax=Pseudoneureclipsis sibuyana TaxID=2904893 RepID=A0A9E8LP89_9NEOP|nr:ATP synthase F0 subunit 8 [Pseudoneureclipsis sibuyana]UZZ44289.1 ATP synthase F0 subunit 8 [Pseudoneureclipsis sibuyana]
MPQMNPFNWTILYIMFSSILTLNLTLNFFNQTLKKMKAKNNLSINTKNKINWK